MMAKPEHPNPEDLHQSFLYYEVKVPVFDFAWSHNQVFELNSIVNGREEEAGAPAMSNSKHVTLFY